MPSLRDEQQRATRRESGNGCLPTLFVSSCSFLGLVRPTRERAARAGRVAQAITDRLDQAFATRLSIGLAHAAELAAPPLGVRDLIKPRDASQHSFAASRVLLAHVADNLNGPAPSQLKGDVATRQRLLRGKGSLAHRPGPVKLRGGIVTSGTSPECLAE
jgi:hypothetical protein